MQETLMESTMTVVADSLTEQLKHRHTAEIMHQVQYRMVAAFFGPPIRIHFLDWKYEVEYKS
jgi:hypothetical protein